MADRYLRACGGNAGAGAGGRQIRPRKLQTLFQRSGDVPHHPARHYGGLSLVASGLACIGTPEDCVRHFERLWPGSNGGFVGVLLLAHNWAGWAATKRSYELMAGHVHPHFQRNPNALRDRSYADAKFKYETASAQSQAAPGRDRQTPAPQGLMPRSDSPISCAWDRGAALKSKSSMAIEGSSSRGRERIPMFSYEPRGRHTDGRAK
jgi:hypothetical protein